MSDPLDRVSDPVLRNQLSRIRSQYGEKLTAGQLRGEIRGFGLGYRRGIYKPAGSSHALWVRETRRGLYPDRDPEFHPDGSWTYLYSPEKTKDGRIDLELPTNRGLLRCQSDHIPVGVFRPDKSGSGSSRYEVLGLALVEGFDGQHFVLRGEPIDWTAPPVAGNRVPEFDPSGAGLVFRSSQDRWLRDRRFGVAVHRIYHERCSLCEIGYRLGDQALALDAAHIIPLPVQVREVNDLRNGLLLCKNHHALFDSFAWTVDDKFRVLVTGDKAFRRSARANHVLKCENRRLTILPDMEENYPASKAIRWRLDEFHRKQD